MPRSNEAIRLCLTPFQAQALLGVVDGAADAGAGSNHPLEQNALGAVMDQLFKQHAKFKHIRIPELK